ncbi:hypothetical protein GE061_009860 [Apolygus lucorum]|uniref:Uncharacterized protein n=1 Tax=Apolygus lucorum TaxID=248454 RepID=A0A6A4ILQ0_APOLU|nr:hypothetical protein GE061_009860 [Apolygus lucorum]
MFSHPRRSANRLSLQTWLPTPGEVLMKRQPPPESKIQALCKQNWRISLMCSNWMANHDLTPMGETSEDSDEEDVQNLTINEVSKPSPSAPCCDPLHTDQVLSRSERTRQLLLDSHGTERSEQKKEITQSHWMIFPTGPIVAAILVERWKVHRQKKCLYRRLSSAFHVLITTRRQGFQEEGYHSIQVNLPQTLPTPSTAFLIFPTFPSHVNPALEDYVLH